MLGQSQSQCPLGAWDQAPARRLRGCLGYCGLDQHGGGLQRVIAAPPGLPKDALLTLLPLPRDGMEVLAIEVGVAAGAKPPTTCQGQRKRNMVRLGSLGLHWGWDGDKAGRWTSHTFFFLGPHLWHMEGSSPARGSNQGSSCWPLSQPQQHHFRATSATYAAACGNSGSFTH